MCCDEFLVHGVDVEGLRAGIQEDLVALLGEVSPIPVTYAGGARDLDDLARVRELGKGRVDLTIGSALDIFGGNLALDAVLQWQREHTALPRHRNRTQQQRALRSFSVLRLHAVLQVSGPISAELIRRQL